MKIIARKTMSEESDIYGPLNIYEEDLNDDTKMDLSKRCLNCVPNINNKLLYALYLNDNNIEKLPDDLFPNLPNLMWLDLRNNDLTIIPTTIKNHRCLTHLLLQNNKITSLPDELGTVSSLRVLQLSGNPLEYPSKEIIDGGVSKIINHLHDKYIESIFKMAQSDCFEDEAGNNDNYKEAISYNSVYELDKPDAQTMKVQFNGKPSVESEGESLRGKVKCHKLAKCRSETLQPFSQSSRYLKPLIADSRCELNEKIKRGIKKERALKKHAEFMTTCDKNLQNRKNLEYIKNWRQNYKYSQHTTDPSYRLDPKSYPYDTNLEHMKFLTRDDIEKDLPDKYRKRLLRRCKPTVPRKSNKDVHLALKIKQLFENLEAIDLNRKDLTPRTEQKILYNEIQKITEIKQKLMELSTVNTNSVNID